ncbi:protein FAM124A [Suncus etruscus]|uniref:protein FAM124A n=1 Tax=Suncus etruscus TaxID=109475 RepID=UPI00210F7289|nr:protein FAM124A [Suncus etruscus]
MDPKPGGGEEDDCVDSGAETGGSDYSHKSSTSSEVSVEETQDPFLVSIHIIADPGASQPLQQAIDKVLAWIHPDLQLFRVSERRANRRRRKGLKAAAQPALAVVLFLQEEYGEEQILQLHCTLQRPPWRHHHTERVPGKFLPYLPCSQDFFTLAPGTPLWAIRPVHYGKEIVRFTIYCRHDNYPDILKFYQLILRRSPSQRKADFCIFPVFSNLDVDIQFSLKRLPRDQTPVPTDSSVLEFRVKDIGELVPLLPNPCSPISEGRWQTEDHDGNKILLQAQRVHRKGSQPGQIHLASEKKPHSLPFLSTTAPRHPPGHSQQPLLDTSQMGLRPTNLPLGQQPELVGPATCPPSLPCSFQRSKSLFSLPIGGASPASSSVPRWFSNTDTPVQRAVDGVILSIDDLEGAQETDVDTGLQLSASDLSVVSAYSAPSRFYNVRETAPLTSSYSNLLCQRRGSKEGLHHFGGGVSPDTSKADISWLTKEPASSLVTIVATSPTSGVSSPPLTSPEQSCQSPQVKRTGRNDTPPATLSRLGDNNNEEFYI